MNKYLVIGNPIDHSLSPTIHNYWIKKNNIKAIYDKERLNSDDLKNLIIKIKERNISGVNVTVPFKKEVIPYLDKLTSGAEVTQSVNTILLTNDSKIVGYNTDIGGFENAIKYTKYDISGKKILILGSGGVTPSIILASSGNVDGNNNSRPFVWRCRKPAMAGFASRKTEAISQFDR